MRHLISAVKTEIFSVTEEGQSQFESFQVSDQAIKLHAKQLYAQPSDAEPNQIRTKEKVLMHTKQGGREDRDKMDTDIVLTRVRACSSSQKR